MGERRQEWRESDDANCSLPLKLLLFLSFSLHSHSSPDNKDGPEGDQGRHLNCLDGVRGELFLRALLEVPTTSDSAA